MACLQFLTITLFVGDYNLAMPTLVFAMLHSMSAPSRDMYFYLFDHIPATKSPVEIGTRWVKISASHTDNLGFVLPRYVSTEIMPALKGRPTLETN